MEILISVIALILSVISGGFAFFTFHWTAARDRKQATLDAYNRLQEQALDYINTYAPAQMKEIAKDAHAPEYKTISLYLARIEHFCVGVNQKIFDPETVYELAHGYFDGGLKRRVDPIISQKNQSGEDFYANIHKVFVWMENETQKREIKRS